MYPKLISLKIRKYKLKIEWHAQFWKNDLLVHVTQPPMSSTRGHTIVERGDCTGKKCSNSEFKLHLLVRAQP